MCFAIVEVEYTDKSSTSSSYRPENETAFSNLLEELKANGRIAKIRVFTHEETLTRISSWQSSTSPTN